MSLEHLKDEEIQAYLDGTLTEKERKEVEFKLSLHEENRLRLEKYSRVYEFLKTAPEPPLSPGFTDKVMQALPSGRKANVFKEYLEIWLSMAGLVLSLGVLSIFIDMSPLTDRFLNIFTRNFNLYSDKAWQFVTSSADKLNGGLMIILFALLVLVLVKIADYLLLQPKYRRIWS